ncbi:MAG: hypothetical protein Q4A61_06285 [Porphyromonadaceae bacterium]|nr:hypothetical protein [Porphyromonadaceae bacterium]
MQTKQELGANVPEGDTPKGWMLHQHHLLILARCVFVRQTPFLPTKPLASVRGNRKPPVRLRTSEVVITNTENL